MHQGNRKHGGENRRRRARRSDPHRRDVLSLASDLERDRLEWRGRLPRYGRLTGRRRQEGCGNARSSGGRCCRGGGFQLRRRWCERRERSDRTYRGSTSLPPGRYRRNRSLSQVRCDRTHAFATGGNGRLNCPCLIRSSRGENGGSGRTNRCWSGDWGRGGRDDIRSEARQGQGKLRRGCNLLSEP